MHSSPLVFGLLYGKKLNLKRNLLHIPDFLGHAIIHDNSYVGKRLHSARKVLSIIGSLGSRLGFTVYVKAAGPIVLRQFLQRFSSSCSLWFDAYFWLKLQPPTGAVVSHSSSLLAKGTSINVIFKTWRTTG